MLPGQRRHENQLRWSGWQSASRAGWSRESGRASERTAPRRVRMLSLLSCTDDRTTAPVSLHSRRWMQNNPGMRRPSYIVVYNRLLYVYINDGNFVVASCFSISK